MKQITVFIEDDQHRQLKAKLAGQGKDISEWLREAVSRFLNSEPAKTWEFENEILELIDNQGDFTRSDLQGCVGAIVTNILRAGKE